MDLNWLGYGGADYPEMFEWEDESQNNEDRIGYFVELHTKKIMLAGNSERIFGSVYPDLHDVIE